MALLRTSIIDSTTPTASARANPAAHAAICYGHCDFYSATATAADDVGDSDLSAAAAAAAATSATQRRRR